MQLSQKKWGAGISAEPQFQQVALSAAAAAVLATVLLQGVDSMQLAVDKLPGNCELPEVVVCTRRQTLLLGTGAAEGPAGMA